MPGVISSAQFLDKVEPIMTDAFDNAYDSYPTEYDKVFNVVKGKPYRWEEDYKIAGFGVAVEKPEGTAVQYDSAEIAYRTRYVSKVYALAYAVTEELMEDGEAPNLGPIFAAEMGKSINETQEIVAADVLNRAQDTNYVGGDGQPLFSTAHPLSGGGTWANRLAGAADLSEASLEALAIMVNRVKDERGKPYPMRIKQLVVPPERMFDAMRLLKSVLRTGTSDNDTNAIRVSGMFPSDPVIMHRLTNTSSYYLITDSQRGLKFIRRRGVRRGSSGDFETGNMQYKADVRFAVGWSDPRCVFGSLGF